MATGSTKSKLLVILGPTSTGKTDLALQLASKFQGELVSVDSRQVYRGLDIGTGKLPSALKISKASLSLSRNVENLKLKIEKANGYWIVDGGKIWMYDVVDPKRQYTVFNYVKDAERVIREIRERGKLPIIVGGTGFYLKALLEGLPNLAIPLDSSLRRKLEKLSLQQLQKRLQELSSDKWEKMNSSDRQNPRRLIRAIEIAMIRSSETLPVIPADAGIQLEKSSSELDSRLRGNDCKDILKIGLTAPRDILYQRIDERVVSRIDQGMIDEAKDLHEKGLSFKRMKQLGLEYGVLADYLEGRIRGIKGDQGLVKIMQNKIHGFARRQLTWFKKEQNIYWFDITDKHFPNNVEKVITKWYYQTTDVTKD